MVLDTRKIMALVTSWRTWNKKKNKSIFIVIKIFIWSKSNTRKDVKKQLLRCLKQVADQEAFVPSWYHQYMGKCLRTLAHTGTRLLCWELVPFQRWGGACSAFQHHVIQFRVEWVFFQWPLITLGMIYNFVCCSGGLFQAEKSLLISFPCTLILNPELLFLAFFCFFTFKLVAQLGWRIWPQPWHPSGC